MRKRCRGPRRPLPRRPSCRGARTRGPLRPAWGRGKLVGRGRCASGNGAGRLRCARWRRRGPPSRSSHCAIAGARGSMGQSGPAASWRRLSLGTRVRSWRGRPVAGSVLERICLNKEFSFVGGFRADCNSSGLVNAGANVRIVVELKRARLPQRPNWC